MIKTLKFAMWCAAPLYALSQTLLFKDAKDFLSILVIFLFIIGPTVIFLQNQKARQYVLTARFFILAGSAFLSTLILTDFSESWTDILKLLALLYSTVLFVDSRGRIALEAYADGALAGTVVIVLLAQIGMIPNEIYTAFDSWTKNLGGFSNPNNAPYFVYLSSLLYFIIGRYRKLILTTAIAVIFYYFEIFSRTYFCAILLLAVASFLLSHHENLYRILFSIIIPVGFFCACVGIVFYAGVIFFPAAFSIYQGTLLDVLTSLRISVALEDSFYSSSSLLGYSVKRLDSLYTELLFYGGPLCSLIFFSRILGIKKRKKMRVVDYRLYTCYLLLLMIGLLEGQLFNLTPVGVFILAFIIIKYKKVAEIMDSAVHALSFRAGKITPIATPP